MVMRYASVSDLNEAVKVVEGKMFVGNREVQGAEEYMSVHEGKVPTLLVIRQKEVTDRIFWGFVTGLDLVGNQVWLGGVMLKWYMDGQQQSFPPAMLDHWEQVERILNNQCSDTAGKEWGIFVEDCNKTEEDEQRQRDEWDRVMESMQHREYDEDDLSTH